jgi:hypothetical protein
MSKHSWVVNMSCHIYTFNGYLRVSTRFQDYLRVSTRNYADYRVLKNLVIVKTEIIMHNYAKLHGIGQIFKSMLIDLIISNNFQKNL